MLDEITPLIITYNEEANIARTLEKLQWARRIVVVDSGSTDDTRNILKSFPQIEIIEHPFSDFASQCNLGLAHIATPWVLSLDADYELSDELVAELASLSSGASGVAYRARFIYRINGRALRGSLYPPRIVLYRRERGYYRNEGHGHRVVVKGTVSALRGVIYHDDRKALPRWFQSQQRYASDEAKHLLSCAKAELGVVDRLRLMAWPAPFLVFLYALLAKRCVFDGWTGWCYALQRLLSEVLLALELLDQREHGRKSG